MLCPTGRIARDARNQVQDGYPRWRHPRIQAPASQGKHNRGDDADRRRRKRGRNLARPRHVPASAASERETAPDKAIASLTDNATSPKRQAYDETPATRGVALSSAHPFDMEGDRWRGCSLSRTMPPCGKILCACSNLRGTNAFAASRSRTPRSRLWRHAPTASCSTFRSPGAYGHEICRSIRQGSNVPIIVLTSSDSEFDEVMSMNVGADDYVVKPYRPAALLRPHRPRGRATAPPTRRAGGLSTAAFLWTPCGPRSRIAAKASSCRATSC